MTRMRSWGWSLCDPAARHELTRPTKRSTTWSSTHERSTKRTGRPARSGKPKRGRSARSGRRKREPAAPQHCFLLRPDSIRYAVAMPGGKYLDAIGLLGGAVHELVGIGGIRQRLRKAFLY